MIGSDEIAIKVYKLLRKARLSISGEVSYDRIDYSKEDVIIIPHTIDGEDSNIRLGQINVNIHVPDIEVDDNNGNKIYVADRKRLIDIRKECIEALRDHYESEEGYNWYIGRLNPPIKEPQFNEHFVTISLELVVREK